jgi:ABC-2 type transport system ATP-binding protein
MIDVRALTKTYDSVIAVRDLSFTARNGEVLGLVGPNGAGKTTTLRSLVGIVNPTSGTIAVDGHDLAHDPLEAKRRVAFIPDEPQLFEYLTVAEHLTFIARLYNVTDATARGGELIRELELEEKRDVFPDGLSRGMKQKLAIACGLLHRPTSLILDEPLTGLDPGSIRRMKDTIRAHAAAGVAVLLSSHLLSLVEELCTRILVIHRGQAVAMGTIAEIKSSRPELEGKGLEDVFLALTEH